MAVRRKYLSTRMTGVEERQIRVIASTPTVDRAGDVVVAEGIDLTAYQANPVILWNHDPSAPIARCVEIGVRDGKLEAVAQFPPEGTDALADRVYGLIKAGVVNATSIGFSPVKETPLKGGGMTVEEAELWEFSFVSVPANPDALVVERSAPEPPVEPVAVEPAPKLKTKGLYAVSWLAGILSELGYLEDNVEWEAETEGDGSPVPAMLAEALRQLGAALVAMTEEEVAELLGEETDAAGAVKSVRRKAITALIKAGRVLSSDNEEALTQARDLINSVLAQLEPAEPEEATPPEEKSVAGIEIRRRRAILARLKSAA